MAKSTSGAKGKGKKGKKGTAQRLLLGAGLLLLGWYLYTRSKKAKQEKALQDSMGAGIPIGDGMGGGQPVHPDTGIPCSQVFGGCPNGGVFPPSGGGGGGGLPPSYPPIYPSGTTVYGCTNAQANNYNPIATTDDNSCTFDAGTTVYGCTNPSASNYDANATNDDLSCTFGGVYGCMNDQANNYDPLATIDDQSCTFDTVIDGCTEPTATNYNSGATVDDGSCVYSEQCWNTCANGGTEVTLQGLPANFVCENGWQGTNYFTNQQNCQERFRCDAGSCLSCGYGASAQNCPHTENTCGNSCAVTVQTQNLSCWTGCNPQSTAVPVNGVGLSETCETVDWGEALYSSQQTCQLPTQNLSCWTGCNPQSTAVPVNGVGVSETCETVDWGEALYSSQQTCELQQQVTCYQCRNNAPVGNQFAQTSCPEGWQPTVPSCETQQVTCYQCRNNAPVGNQFAQTSCPEGWQSTVPSCTTQTTERGGIGGGGTQAVSRFSGFAGGEKSFGDWQRTMANKIMINDLDWNPQTSE